ncbi:stromelysin-1-like [Diadema setosum]|uniref:stromelysin-1-like n=1 Tax=Diadema setosum TaxID=31175 RepID=UPI003B3BC304
MTARLAHCRIAPRCPVTRNTAISLLLSLLMLKSIAAFVLPVDSSITEDQGKCFLETLEYLAKYGYLSVSPGKAPSTLAVQTAVADLQAFMDISPTGVVNKKTLDTVRTPRCGLKDPVSRMTNEVGGAETTHYGPRWNKTDLTYKIFKFPSGARKTKFRSAIERAFQLWSDVTTLNFREVKRKSPADIDIRFYSGYHMDSMPFDNEGRMVGHPLQADEGGRHVVRLDVDADENFSFGSDEGINLYQVMAHQIGHALGLGHSSNHDSVMSPCTKPYMADFALSPSDISGIRGLYGSPNPPSSPSRPLRTPSPIQHSEPLFLCEERPLDAVAVLAGQIYVFKGNRFWQFSAPNRLASPVSGTPISQRWPDLPSGIHAVYQRLTDNKAVFIKGGSMWVYDVHPKFHEESATASYSRISMRDLGLPRSVDVALPCEEWPGSTYLVKRGKVWHYSDQSETTMPGPLQARDLWEGLPKRLDAAFTYRGDSYFVLGREYFKVDSLSRQVAEGYPRSFPADFLGC